MFQNLDCNYFNWLQGFALCVTQFRFEIFDKQPRKIVGCDKYFTYVYSQLLLGS